MLNFEMACEIALKFLKETNHLEGFRCIRENEHSWFFSGCFDKDEVVDYGDLPIRVCKKTGKCEYFEMFLPKNLKEYNSASKIEVSEKNRL